MWALLSRLQSFRRQEEMTCVPGNLRLAAGDLLRRSILEDVKSEEAE